MKRYPLFLTVILALPCAFADEKEQSENPAITLPAVEVSSGSEDYNSTNGFTANRTDTPLLQTPQSVQVVPRSVIEDQNSGQLSNALRNVSGVQFDFGFNGSAQPLVILRGFSSSSQSGGSSMAGSSTYYLDGTKVHGVPVNMFNVESVEVVKGPSTVLYGRSEPGGLINIVSKPISSVRHLGFEQTVGQYGLTFTGVEATGAVNKSKSLSGRLAGSYSSSNSIRDFVEDKLGAVSGGLSWNIDNRTSLTATADYTDQKYRSDYGVPAIGSRPADLPWSRQFNNSPELSKAQTTVLKLEATREFSKDWSAKGKYLNLRAKTSEMDIAHYRVNMGSPDPTQDCPGTGNPQCRYYFGATPDGRTSIDQFSLDILGKFATGPIRHKFFIGVEDYKSNRTGTSYQQQLSSIDIYVPQPSNGPPLDISIARASENQDRSDWTSLYTQDQIELTKGLFLTGAIRTDRTSAAFGRANVALNEQTFTTPRVQLLWQFAENQSVYVQYQDAVSANNGRDAITNEALSAEKARAWEVGHKLETQDKRLSSTIALYQLTKTDRGSIVRINQTPFFTIVPVGEARSRGIEWDLTGEITNRLSLIASYAYTDAVITKDLQFQDKQIPNVARHSGSLWSRYKFSERWLVGAGVFAMGERQGDQGNTFQMPGYTRFDGMAGYIFTMFDAKSSLQLNIDNIFDTKYYEGSHQFVADWIRLGSPRTAKLTLRIDI